MLSLAVSSCDVISIERWLTDLDKNVMSFDVFLSLLDLCGKSSGQMSQPFDDISISMRGNQLIVNNLEDSSLGLDHVGTC